MTRTARAEVEPDGGMVIGQQRFLPTKNAIKPVRIPPRGWLRVAVIPGEHPGRRPGPRQRPLRYLCIDGEEARRVRARARVVLCVCVCRARARACLRACV